MANKALIYLLRIYQPEHIHNIIMHDWWLYLTASCFGHVFYDDKSYILYRQHGHNTSGAMLNRRALLKYRLKAWNSVRGDVYKQAEEFQTFALKVQKGEHYFCQDKILLIQKLLSAQKYLTGRILVATDRNFFRQRKSDDFIFRGITLIGKL